MDSLSKLKCFGCTWLPDSADVELCTFGHIICSYCSRRARGFCKCNAKLSGKVPNPILSKIKQNEEHINEVPCRFHDLGCTWKFSPEAMRNHIEECRYRIINCIGVTLSIWECKWQGQILQTIEHFRANHSMGEIFSYFTEHCVSFNDASTIGTINLIDAYNKTFVFYYHSDSVKKLIYFSILLIGREKDAIKFFYEFTIKSPEESKRKIKFVEDVYTTNQCIEEFLTKEKCVVLSHENLKSHLYQNNIYFRFIVSKKDDKNTKSEVKIDAFGNMLISKPKFVTGKASGVQLNQNKNVRQIENSSSTLPNKTVARASNYTSINKIELKSSANRTPSLMPSINKFVTVDENVISKDCINVSDNYVENGNNLNLNRNQRRGDRRHNNRSQNKKETKTDNHSNGAEMKKGNPKKS